MTTNRNRDLVRDKKNELLMKDILNNQYDNVIIERVDDGNLVCCVDTTPRQSIQEQLRKIGCRLDDDINCGFTIWLKMQHTQYGIQWFMNWIITIAITCCMIGVCSLIYHYYELAQLLW